MLYFVAALAACPPGPAFWMPRSLVGHGEAAPLPLHPYLRIACCDGVVGAVPDNPRLVSAVWEHGGLLYAILTPSTPNITCPPRTTPWQAPRARAQRSPPRVYPQTELSGYLRHEHSACTALQIVEATPDACAAFCNGTETCEAFVHTPPRSCGVCESFAKTPRASAGTVVYAKRARRPRATGHHPLWLSGSLVAVAAIVAVAASLYASH